MKRAMTHRLQLFQQLDGSTDRLSSHVAITLQAGGRGKGSQVCKWSAPQRSLRTTERDGGKVRMRFVVLGWNQGKGWFGMTPGFLQTQRGMAYEIVSNSSLKSLPVSAFPAFHPLYVAHFSSSTYLVVKSFAVALFMGLPLCCVLCAM